VCRGFDLPASKVVHTVGPIYESDEISAEPLAKAYRYIFERMVVLQ
jgi:O-acetyl-ADP-ribose deacetylase (regulator of RNase III)